MKQIILVDLKKKNFAPEVEIDFGQLVFPRILLIVISYVKKLKCVNIMLCCIITVNKQGIIFNLDNSDLLFWQRKVSIFVINRQDTEGWQSHVMIIMKRFVYAY